MEDGRAERLFLLKSTTFSSCRSPIHSGIELSWLPDSCSSCSSVNLFIAAGTCRIALPDMSSAVIRSAQCAGRKPSATTMPRDTHSSRFVFFSAKSVTVALECKRFWMRRIWPLLRGLTSNSLVLRRPDWLRLETSWSEMSISTTCRCLPRNASIALPASRPAPFEAMLMRRSLRLPEMSMRLRSSVTATSSSPLQDMSISCRSWLRSTESRRML
mmetsp:Transcript_10523/g.42936  ORF Transcript_10523/g.42936 Transcript_10523/m.42936 type:complete len:215 (+) Transcript_10523:2524-3168(+)